jgi:hypothetical protein
MIWSSTHQLKKPLTMSCQTLIKENMLTKQGAEFLTLTRLLFATDLAEGARDGCGYQCRQPTDPKVPIKKAFTATVKVEAKLNCALVDESEGTLCDCTFVWLAEEYQYCGLKTEDPSAHAACHKPAQPCHHAAPISNVATHIMVLAMAGHKSQDGLCALDWQSG